MSTDPLHAHVVVELDGFALDVEIHAEPGQTTAVLGPNGAGKSTLLAAIAGLVPLDAGQVHVGERVLEDPAAGIRVPARDRAVGLVFQEPLLFSHLTVLENVAFGPRSSGAAKDPARALARRWLDRLGIVQLADRAVSGLSGGQAQRVALARALAREPDLVLLDEPLSALDVSARSSLRQVLADELARIAGPRLLVTHDPSEAFLLADVVHVVESGRLTQVGTPDELRLHPNTRYAADLAGINLLMGTAAGGLVDVGEHTLQVADVAVSGPVLLTIHPRAIALHTDEPSGSPRNSWPTVVERVEDLGDRVRVLLGAPVPLTVEVTPAAVDALALARGRPAWAAVKATEITVRPEHANG